MNIALVNPPPPRIIEYGDAPDNPHLGLGYIAAFVRSKNIECAVIDAKFETVGLEEVQDAGVNLMLSGHTHAGQFFPFILFAYVIWKRPRRLYKYKGSYLYVTHGTGTWGPPLRLGTSSEITMIRLVGG